METTHGGKVSTGAKLLVGGLVAGGVFWALSSKAKASTTSGSTSCDVADLPDNPNGAGLRSKVQKALPTATTADIGSLKLLLTEVQDLPGGCPKAAQSIAQKIADLESKTSSGGGGTPSGVSCKDSKTWPPDVQSMWSDFELNKGSFVAAGKAPALRARFVSLGCPTQVTVVDAAVAASKTSGAPPTGAPGGDAAWCASHGGCNCDDSGLTRIPPDLRTSLFAFQENVGKNIGNADVLIARLNAIGGSCKTIAAAIASLKKDFMAAGMGGEAFGGDFGTSSGPSGMDAGFPRAGD